MRRRFRLREKLGVLLRDAPRWMHHLELKRSWVDVCNRGEQFERSTESAGLRCGWRGTSSLHASDVFPSFGGWLMRRALREWPIRGASEIRGGGDPILSFIIPFRGRERLPHLKLVLQSLCAQEEVSLECAVVELGEESVVGHLPKGTQHIWLRQKAEDPWRKCEAMNRAAKQARGRVLVFHDADILAPSGYAREIMDWVGRGYGAVQLGRFLFCLDEEGTEAAFAGADAGWQRVLEVRQNWQGGTLAVSREGFERIGGFDETFYDWGGEDIEFMDRCSLLNPFQFGYVPFVHLWHREQSGKGGSRHRNDELLEKKLATSAARRVSELVARRGR